MFDQATGLKKMAPVEMAGIQIGQVEKIALDHGKARVTMLISKDVPLSQDVSALIRTRGVLGDKYVAMEPGTPSAPKLADGQQITRARRAHRPGSGDGPGGRGGRQTSARSPNPSRFPSLRLSPPATSARPWPTFAS